MADYPQSPIVPRFISSFTRWSAGGEFQGGLTFASLTWNEANRAAYTPIWLPWFFPVRRVFWMNGASVTSANVDLGIYSASGARIYSTGSTAMSGVNVLQYVTPTEFLLSPGCYYLAIALSSVTADRGGSGRTGMNVNRMAMVGMLEEASALPLPAVMTPVTPATTGNLPLCGITSTSTGF